MLQQTCVNHGLTRLNKFVLTFSPYVRLVLMCVISFATRLYLVLLTIIQICDTMGQNLVP
jgi:hypothetical protein